MTRPFRGGNESVDGSNITVYVRGNAMNWPAAQLTIEFERLYRAHYIQTHPDQTGLYRLGLIYRSDALDQMHSQYKANSLRSQVKFFVWNR